MKEYTEVYMSKEDNVKMIEQGKTVEGSLIPVEGYIKIISGNDRIIEKGYPVALVKPIKEWERLNNEKDY